MFHIDEQRRDSHQTVVVPRREDSQGVSIAIVFPPGAQPGPTPKGVVVIAGGNEFIPFAGQQIPLLEVVDQIDLEHRRRP